MTSKIRWYLNRLRLMSLPEAAHRLKTAICARAEPLLGRLASRVPAPDLAASSEVWFKGDPGIPAEPYLEAADSILKGRLKILSEDVDLGDIPVWNRNPVTGETAPLVFGKTLDYRDPRIVGDIKYLWILNRHLQLVVLGQAYFLGREQVYLDGIRTQLDSWFAQCQHLKGPNWTSSLELAIRLISWSVLWRLVGGLESPLFKGHGGQGLKMRWLESIYLHARFVKGHFSRYSSANNHLIGEAAGLYVASVTWPFWKDFDSWRQKSGDILVQEALKQNGPDGVNQEQTIFYQQFVLDFLLAAGLAGRVNNMDFPAGYWRRIESMLEFLASVMDVAGNVPMIGDSDDGYVMNYSLEHDFHPCRSLLAMGAVLFGRGEFKAKAVCMDHKNRWILGGAADKDFTDLEAGKASLPVRREFPQGGYYILGRDFETENEVRLIVDSGPLGYLSIAAHGHADALAVHLSVAGREVLVDPGTYAYQTKKKWRNYFRGTSAHNTVRVDGVDQSVIGGNFMWLEKASARCEAWEPGEDTDRFVGSHDGYSRLGDPVLHRREVVYDKREQKILVTDTVECKGEHELERFWHFSPDCGVEREGRAVTAVTGGVRVRVEALEDEAELSLYSGDKDLPQGWVSRRFDVKVPAYVAVWKGAVSGPGRFQTVISIG